MNYSNIPLKEKELPRSREKKLQKQNSSSMRQQKKSGSNCLALYILQVFVITEGSYLRHYIKIFKKIIDVDKRIEYAS